MEESALSPRLPTSKPFKIHKETELTTSLNMHSLSKLPSCCSNYFLLSIPSIAFFGAQLSWALQGGFATAQLESYGMSASLINYAWLAGPITGMMVQPLIGVWSDSLENKENRRRPFILIGTLFVIITLLLFSNAAYISSYYALLIAILSFWLLDISTNVLQAPLRALISDIIPLKYHSISNASFGLFSGLGLSVGYGLGFTLSYNAALGCGITLLFACGAIIIAISSTVTLIYSKGEQLLDITLNAHDFDIQAMEAINDEEISPLTGAIDAPPVIESHDENNHKCKFLMDILYAIYRMPQPIFRAFIVQCWAYLAHFAVAMYLTDWFGKNIMNGSPYSDDGEDAVALYEKGIQYANIGLFIMSVLSIPISLCLPYFYQSLGYKMIWFITLFVYGVVLIVLSLLRGEEMIALAICLISLMSLPHATSQVVGWNIVTQSLSMHSMNNMDKSALYTTIFNLANCIPELIIALTAGWIVHLCNGDVSGVLFTGGIACFVGCIASCFLVHPSSMQ